MTPIIKSAGITPSERYLSCLCERTFLSLWSYPNLYRDQGNVGEGKELCDLLVVCGNHIIIFSEKTIRFPDTGNVNTDWIRWFKKAVLKSAKQIQGAERWIRLYPHRIFTDKQCTQKFPLEINIDGTKKIHRVVVASGAEDRCKQWYEGGLGSFVIFPELEGMEHIDLQHYNYSPFTVGNIMPEHGFVHVFNDSTIELIFQELDTITDFVNYLLKKEQFFSSGKLGCATGEEELLAIYLGDINQGGEHDFVFSKCDGYNKRVDKLFIESGFWEEMLSSPQYRAKKAEDEISYRWDRMIGYYAGLIIDGKMRSHSVELTEEQMEKIIRYMTLETRVHRRILARSIIDAIAAIPRGMRFFRCIYPDLSTDFKRPAYVFFQLPTPSRDIGVTYDDYCYVRRLFLFNYCAAVFLDNPNTKSVVGIAMSPPKFTKPEELSEDLLLLEDCEFSDKELEDINAFRQKHGILNEGTTSYYSIKGNEYPDERKPGMTISPSTKEILIKTKIKI